MLRRKLVCSFCRKDETRVAKLVAGPKMFIVGPKVLICDECVAVANRLMQEPSPDRPQQPVSRPSLFEKLLARIRRDAHRHSRRPAECRPVAL